MTASPTPITVFVERRGPEAAHALAELRGRLRAAGHAARLLASVEDPALHLLVVEGEPALGADDLRGARTWRFRAAEAP